MPKSPRLRSKLVLVFLLTVALLQSAVPLADARVRKLGEMLKCQCGCGASITECNMINCHFADPVRDELLKMVESGMSEQAILDSFMEKHGKVILRKPPRKALSGGVGDAVCRRGGRTGLDLADPAAVPIAASGGRGERNGGGGPGGEPGTGAVPPTRIEKDLADLE